MEYRQGAILGSVVRCQFPKLGPMRGYAATGRMHSREHELVALRGFASPARIMVLQVLRCHSPA